MTLLGLIGDEVDRHGPLPFSRYMELALYHPSLGFYARGGAGRRRDFITSPEVGPLFGAVVARAIDSWWDEAGSPARFTFVEAGAGPGTLARTVLRSPMRCADALRYVTVESSEAQRSRHPEGVTAVASLADVADVAEAEIGVVFANELLDNLPFDILSFAGGRGWREVRVGRDGERLTEVLVDTDRGGPTPGGPGSDPDADTHPGTDPNAERRVPVQAQAADWVAAARRTVGRGRVVVIDYAVPRYPTRPDRDWLRTYSDQGRAGDPLAAPGTKDITADVDIAQLGAAVAADSVQRQADWLRLMGIDDLVAEGAAHWDRHRAAPDLRAIEMRSRATEAAALLDPDGLGGFSVLEWVVGGSETDVTR